MFHKTLTSANYKPPLLLSLNSYELDLIVLKNQNNQLIKTNFKLNIIKKNVNITYQKKKKFKSCC